MNRRWEYKGSETALNGLLLWMQDNIIVKGDAHTRMLSCMRIIVDYGKIYISEFIGKGHLEHKADWLAKHIQSEGKFQHFADWVSKQPV